MTVRRALWLSCLFLFLASLHFTATAQTNERTTSAMEETWSAACSSKIEHPLYPAAALLSGLMGSVSADIAIDADGKATTVALSGPAPLAEAVRTAIGGTILPTNCTGRRFQVTFSFQTKVSLASPYYVSTCFSHPPNVFSVIANTIKMVCSNYVYTSALVGPGGIFPITVCELLADPMAYDGKDVALLGRYDDSHFDGSWVSEDNCGSKLTTDGYVWPNRVWLAGSVGSGPAPPLGLLVLDPSALGQKLESVRRTTSLNMEEVSFYGKDGQGGTRLVKQHWAVIFGRIEARKQLRPPRPLPNRDWGNGFGQMSSAPAQIIFTQENEFYVEDTGSGK